MELSEQPSGLQGTTDLQPDRQCRRPLSLVKQVAFLLAAVALTKGLMLAVAVSCKSLLYGLRMAPQEKELNAAEQLAQCQVDLNTTAKLLSAVSVQLETTQEEMCRLCPPAWSCYKTHCYFFSAGREEVHTWNESIQFCRQWEASLAVIEDLQEMEFIQAEMRMFPLPQFLWVGLTDSIQEDLWVWQDRILHQDLALPSVQWNTDHRDCADVRGACSL
ncbi:C-type lectin domain family 12 member B-like isoform X1 [Arapaima gigas]